MGLLSARRHPDPCATFVLRRAVPTDRWLCTLASAPAPRRIWNQAPNDAVSATTTFGEHTLTAGELLLAGFSNGVRFPGSSTWLRDMDPRTCETYGEKPHSPGSSIRVQGRLMRGPGMQRPWGYWVGSSSSWS
jgi:hypothetical protein